MDPTLDHTFENEKRLLPFTSEENSPENPYRPIKIWRRFSHAIFAFFISYLAFLLFEYMPQSPPPAKPYMENYLNQITNISIYLNKNTIQASSDHDQFLPLFVSRRIQDLEPPSEASVDLLCVFDFSPQKYQYWSDKEKTEQVRYLLKAILPFTSDQDRLSVVPLNSLYDDGQILSILPFTNVTQKIFSAVGANILRGNTSKISGGGKAALKVLNRRNGTNQTTGIFFFTHVHERSLRGGGILLDDFRRENKGAIIEVFPTNYIDLAGAFTERLKGLRTGVKWDQLLIRAEESRVLKGVRVFSDYEKGFNRLEWLRKVNEPLVVPTLGFQLGRQEEFVFDLKVPRIRSALTESPIEVKIASCQQILYLVDGSQVVKNVDFMVTIVGERERVCP